MFMPKRQYAMSPVAIQRISMSIEPLTVVDAENLLTARALSRISIISSQRLENCFDRHLA